MATIIGINGDETLSGTTEDDRIEGLEGIDTISGDDGDDVIYGQGGADDLNGEGGSDYIYGGSGDDVIRGDTSYSGPGFASSSFTSTLVNGNPFSTSLESGYVTNEASALFTGRIGQTVATANTNVAYVIDVSGSMSATFAGSVTVGDLNGDGVSNTLIDGAIASYRALNEAIVSAGFGSADVRIIIYGDGGQILGNASASADSDADGETDISELLRTLSFTGPLDAATNFEAGLQQAVTFFQGQPPGESNYMFFLSDGFPNAGGTTADEIAALQALGVARSAIGLGSGSSLADLNPIASDGSAEQVLDPAALTAGLLGSPIAPTAVTDVKLYVNGAFVRTIPGSALVSTPLGLTYQAVLPLEVAEDDVVQATVTFADGTVSTNTLTIIEPEQGDDYIDGGSGNDEIYGGLGDDDLRGSAGFDTLYGEQGEDRLWGGSNDDLLEGGQGDDALDGGSGSDTASYANSARAVTVDLELGTARAGRDGDGFDTLRSIENVEGSALSDSIYGDIGNNVLSGGDSADLLDGRDGNDTLIGGGGGDRLFAGNGTDRLSGGSGDDRYFVVGTATPGATGPSVFIEDTSGIDTIDMTGALGPAVFNLTTGGTVNGRLVRIDGGETTIAPLDLVFSQDLTGSFVDDLAAVLPLLPAVIDAVQAVQPQTRFGVTSFRDKPVSPLGDPADLPYYTNVALTTDEASIIAGYSGFVASSGADTPESQLEALLQLGLRTGEVGWSANATKVVVMFTDAEFHIAGEGPTTPNDGDAVLDGTPPGSGEDYPTIAQVRAALLAADIIPIFAATAGVESSYTSLVAQLGFGTVVTLAGDSSNIVEAITDALEFISSATVIENLVGTGFDDSLTGNDVVNTIFGGAGNDTINGGLGADFLIGEGGNDTYIVDTGDRITEVVGAAGGADTARAETSYALNAGAAVETVVFNIFSGTSAFNLTGNELAQTIWGNNGANSLSGLGGDDTIYGQAGADFLNGGTGVDTLIGGNDNDTYIAVETGDIIVEAAGTAAGNNDSVRALTTYTLATGVAVETLQFNDFAGVTALNLTGNELGQAIFGNNGINVLSGLGGDDTLNGQAGADFLNGGTGNDTLNGGNDNDTYVAVEAGDIIVEAIGAAGGVDNVRALGSYTLNAGAAVETLQFNDFTGLGAFNLTGNELGQTLFGNSGNNTLSGFAGADTLRGEIGNDTLIGGEGGDSLIGGAGADNFRFTSLTDGLDFVADFTQGQDRIEVQGSVFGLAAGPLVAAAFIANGTGFSNAGQRFWYNTTADTLTFDSNGSTAGGTVYTFASFTATPALVLGATDIFII